jgi:hypothetical protein
VLAGDDVKRIGELGRVRHDIEGGEAEGGFGFHGKPLVKQRARLFPKVFEVWTGG